jgi:Protein of unknown function (DUF2778)
LIRVGVGSVAAGLAGLTVIFSLGVVAAVYGYEPADAARGKIAETESPSDSSATPAAPTLFDQRFSASQSVPPSRSLQASVSFEDRFSATAPTGSVVVKSVTAALPVTAKAAVPAPRAPKVAASAPSPRVAARPVEPHVATRSVAGEPPQPPAATYHVASLSDTQVSAYAPADAVTKDPVIPDPAMSIDPSHTAIYDISAHTVYLPNGERLEAHSGLGENIDDVHSVSLKSRGVTPPNVYDLTPRESLFHGVRALRMTPIDSGKMYGREGILAHSFMLGPSGQSNGCVSFRDYPAFLNAYLRGDVTRLVVVEQLNDPPSASTAGVWFSNALRDIFGHS